MKGEGVCLFEQIIGETWASVRLHMSGHLPRLALMCLWAHVARFTALCHERRPPSGCSVIVGWRRPKLDPSEREGATARPETYTDVRDVRCARFLRVIFASLTAAMMNCFACLLVLDSDERLT